MSLNRRHFLLLAATSAVSTMLPGKAKAASLKLGPRITFPKSPGVSVVAPNVVPLKGAKFRAAFSPQDSGAWAVSYDLDYSGDSGKSVGTRHKIGKGAFKSVSCSPVRLPTSRVAIYGEELSVYFQALSAAGAPSGARIKISGGLHQAESLRAIQLTNGNFLVAWVNRSLAIVGRMCFRQGQGPQQIIVAGSRREGFGNRGLVQGRSVSAAKWCVRCGLQRQFRRGVQALHGQGGGRWAGAAGRRARGQSDPGCRPDPDARWRCDGGLSQ